MVANVFNFPIRVYYEDTDAGGVVYHARYLHFFERARTEYLHCAGFSQHTLLNEQQLAFVVKTMNIDYRYPAKLDNLLIVETLVTELKGASIFFTQRLKKEEQILCEATVKVACVDLGKMKPIAIPAEMKAVLVNEL
ncbi:TPA: tol-pal system-associated acyl-CoA thioesterase [Pasteurella multocida]|nr:tol-pal system-associated acyl-CoA thioesterase [Pasteurella multocida]HDR1019759.1 tol-pal system-associated acyl-CoA thioesterase [Pasteurella multocida]HDR1033004.1 tol-pal system-associated acyl-CoA thioesterase [Pasteurella multocida]HDR1298387.1 tol-pal system-associated acyl-CoA thioesterase [Pasteurella multocida]